MRAQKNPLTQALLVLALIDNESIANELAPSPGLEPGTHGLTVRVGQKQQQLFNPFSAVAALLGFNLWKHLIEVAPIRFHSYRRRVALVSLRYAPTFQRFVLI